MNESIYILFKNGPFPATFFFIFIFSIQLTVNKCSIYKFLPMTGFKLQNSGFGSTHSINWATTTAQGQSKLETDTVWSFWVEGDEVVNCCVYNKSKQNKQLLHGSKI